MAAKETEETQGLIDDGLDQIRDEVAKGVKTIGDVARGVAETLKDAIVEGTRKTFAPDPTSEETEQKKQDIKPISEIMQETGQSIQADLQKIFNTTKKEEKEE